MTFLAIWNTQGINPTSFFLSSSHGFTGDYQGRPDFICISEAGDATYGGNLLNPVAVNWNPPPSFQTYTPFLGLQVNVEVYNGYHVEWQASVNGNSRCSLAIMWRDEFGTHAAMPISGWSSGHANHRPVFWVNPANANLPRVGCIHAPAGGDAGYVTSALQKIAAVPRASGWILGGDLNINLPTNAAQVPQVQVQHTAVHSAAPTQTSGSNLDYMLHDSPVAPAGCQSAENYVASDHLQVRFS